MKFFLPVFALLLAACATTTGLVPLAQVPAGYAQSECWFQESKDQHARLQDIEYGGRPPDIVCSHNRAAVEQSPEERAWQQKIAAQLDDPDIHSYVADLCARAGTMTSSERAQEAQKLHDIYHLTATCLSAGVAETGP
jgi:hypothetical protein